MRVIRIDQVQAGQVTAAVVQNASGGTLIGVGTTLSAAHIRSLKTAGVETVTIDAGGSEATNAAFSPIARLQALGDRFHGVSDPTLLQIHKVVAARLQAMMTGSE